MESQMQIAPVFAVAVAVTPSRPRPRTRFPLLAALTTAGLLWLCYFPVDCGWLAWFAFVPFLVLVRSTARPRWVYLCAWVAGLAFYFPALQWMRVADPRMYVTWLGLFPYRSPNYPFIRPAHRSAVGSDATCGVDGPGIFSRLVPHRLFVVSPRPHAA
jgi:apolipoprotein N-acyltransferase